MPTVLGSHRLSQAPAGPPARPARSLPVDRDVVNIRKFGDEFDTVPLPDKAAAKAIAPVCNEKNMMFIRSLIPASVHFEFDQFFAKMAKHQWSAARPTAGLLKRVPMGLHRPGTTPDTAKPLYRGPAATDWKKIRDLERVNAYVFRGDKRPPDQVKAANGFHPPCVRTDDRYLAVIADRFAKYMKSNFNRDVEPNEVVNYIKGQGPAGRVFVEYEIWRSILDSEKFHIGRMVADEFLRGYVSTSRNVFIAKSFATQSNASADGFKTRSYGVYALHSEGGFLLPPAADHVHGTKEFEAEIAHPGSMPWRKVMAFRAGTNVDLNDERTFVRSEVIFVRRGFQEADPRGFAQVVASLGTLETV